MSAIFGIVFFMFTITFLLTFATAIYSEDMISNNPATIAIFCLMSVPAPIFVIEGVIPLLYFNLVMLFVGTLVVAIAGIVSSKLESNDTTFRIFLSLLLVILYTDFILLVPWTLVELYWYVLFLDYGLS